MTSRAIGAVVAGVILLTSPEFIGPVHGTQFEPFERANKASLALQEEVTRLSIEPVVAALKRATGADSALAASLSKIRFTATPHIMRPTNAYQGLHGLHGRDWPDSAAAGPVPSGRIEHAAVLRIPNAFEGGATPPARMHRPSNAARLSLRAAATARRPRAC